VSVSSIPLVLCFFYFPLTKKVIVVYWLQIVIAENLKSCHDSGHRGTIGLAERMVLEMENHDTIWEIVTRFNNFLTKFP